MEHGSQDIRIGYMASPRAVEANDDNQSPVRAPKKQTRVNAGPSTVVANDDNQGLVRAPKKHTRVNAEPGDAAAVANEAYRRQLRAEMDALYRPVQDGASQEVRRPQASQYPSKRSCRHVRRKPTIIANPGVIVNGPIQDSVTQEVHRAETHERTRDSLGKAVAHADSGAIHHPVQNDTPQEVCHARGKAVGDANVDVAPQTPRFLAPPVRSPNAPSPSSGSSPLFIVEFGQIINLPQHEIDAAARLLKQSNSSYFPKQSTPTINPPTPTPAQTRPVLEASKFPEELQLTLKGHRNSVFLDADLLPKMYGKTTPDERVDPAKSYHAYQRELALHEKNAQSTQIRDSNVSYEMIYKYAKEQTCHRHPYLVPPGASRAIPGLPEEEEPAAEEDVAAIPDDLPARPENAFGKQRPNEDLYVVSPFHNLSAWPECLENGTPMKLGGTVLVELRNIIGLTENAIKKARDYQIPSNIFASLKESVMPQKIFESLRFLMAALEHVLERFREMSFVDDIDAGAIRKLWMIMAGQFNELAARLRVVAGAMSYAKSKKTRIDGQIRILLDYLGSMCYIVDRLVRTVHFLIVTKIVEWEEVREDLLEVYNLLKPAAGVLSKGEVTQDEATKKLAADCEFVGVRPGMSTLPPVAAAAGSSSSSETRPRANAITAYPPHSNGSRYPVMPRTPAPVARRI